MNDVEVIALLDAQPQPLNAVGAARAAWQRAGGGQLFTRYIIVSGVLGVPASIAQLTVMLAIYRAYLGDVNVITLNALWLLNFELGVMRNFALHCLWTWRTAPTWQRARNAHVAATGALMIDMVAFNAVVSTTGIIPLAQLFGAGSGFAFNFSYNKLRTFAHATHESQRGGPL